jgi:hypothetical protein
MDLQNVKTGDLLLFQYSNFGSYFIKLAIGSKFNHLAMVVCIDPEKLPDIKIIQSGGIICSLENDLKYFEENSKQQYLILKKINLKENKTFTYRSIDGKYCTQYFFDKCSNFIKSNVFEYLDETRVKIKNVIRSDRSDISPVTLKNVFYIPRNREKNCSELIYSLYYYSYPEIFKRKHFFYTPTHFLEPEMKDIFGKQITIVDNYNSTNYYNFVLFILAIIVIIILIIYLIMLLTNKLRYNK